MLKNLANIVIQRRVLDGASASVFLRLNFAEKTKGKYGFFWFGFFVSGAVRTTMLARHVEDVYWELCVAMDGDARREEGSRTVRLVKFLL